MAKTLKISNELVLPIEAVTEKLAFLGRTGSGKTYAAMKVAELMLDAGAQVGAIDPVGVWRALRVPAEKGGHSFDVVVFGGLYGDLPLEGTEHAGTVVADLVCDRGLSFVLDISQFIPAEQQRVVRAFADRFFHRRKSAPAAVHLFLEECQEYIPENPSGQEALTLGVMQRLWKLGRNFGIGGSLISQRPQEISKKALNMSGTMFAFQMTGPQERKAVKGWVADHGVAIDIESVLQKLDVGEPHVESPTFLSVSSTIRILPRVTADLSSTPKVGTNQVARRPLTPIDVEQLRAALKDTIERAKADDPKELKKQIAELRVTNTKLQSEAHRVSKSSVPSVTGEKRSAAVLTARDRDVLERLVVRLEALETFIRSESEAVKESVQKKLAAAINTATLDMERLLETGRQQFLDRLGHHGFAGVLEKLKRVTVAEAAYKITSQSHPPPVKQSVVSRPVRQVNGTSAKGLEQRILNALYRANGGPLRRDQLGVRCVARHDTGHFGNSLSALKAEGLIESGLDGFVLSARSDTPLSNAQPDLVAEWKRKLSGLEVQIFDELLKVYPGALTRDQLGELTGKRPGTGHFGNCLSTLRSNGIAESTGRGSELKVSPELFQ